MFQQTYRLLLSGSLALVLAAALVAPSIAGTPAGTRRHASPQEKGKSKIPNPFGGKKDDNKDKNAGDNAPKSSKQEREYQKIKQFSLDLYNKDNDFREEVEEAFTQKRREHSEYAFYINTRDAADEQVTRSGDKLKIEDTLYDNPLVQDYVNRVGQSVVPKNSSKLFAFKVTLNPIPEARSLSTGTIYISSGLLSLADNEAQLAYVLGHEIAHVERDHWREDALVARGIERYNQAQARKRGLWTLVAAGATAGIAGGATGSFNSALGYGALAGFGAATLLKFLVPNATVAWDKQQEDEADQLGLKYMFERNYDPREVPKLYEVLQRASRDGRARLGFMADETRVAERMQQVNSVIGGLSLTSALTAGSTNLRNLRPGNVAPENPAAPGKALDPARDAANRAANAAKSIGGQLAPDLKAKLDAGELIGSSAEFEAVMAELKRDNGVRAYYFDMFQMSKDNLEESLRIRSNDPFAHLYYGKVLKLTARTPAEKNRALFEFKKAIELDVRRVLPEPHLYRALAMIDSKDPALTREIVSSLQEYVTLYQREHVGNLPPNMEVIYDYLQEVGELSWAARPAMNVSTKNIDPIGISSGNVVSQPVQYNPAPAVDPTASPAKPAPPAKRRP